MRSLVAIMILVTALAGCTDQSEAPEVEDEVPDPIVPVLYGPLEQGPFTWNVTDYELGETTVGGPDAAHDQYEYTSQVRGTLSMPAGDGPFPLAVFLHGQHSTCSDGQGGEGSNCDIPYRNDQGYLYLMEHLASHGIATASILAHEINQQNGAGDVGMWARGELVLATIDALAESMGTQLDLSRIGLMGHSRGGEGVVTAVEINQGRATPHALAGVIALAPTDFAYRSAPDVPFLTLAPYCDGDVYSLHGLRQFDQTRYTDDETVKIQLLVMGANHNNYNTKWGKPAPNEVQRGGDDAPVGRHQNPDCDLNRDQGGGRLTLEETYAQSILHLGGFLRWTLLGDEAAGLHFQGAEQPAETCPMESACPGATHVSTMAPGRQDLFWAESGGPVSVDGVTVSDTPVCRMDDCAANVYQSAWMQDISIVSEAEHTLRFEPAWDVSDTPVFNVRVGVPTHASVTAAGPPDLEITFVGNETVTVQIDDPALFMPPALPVDPGAGALGFVTLGGSKVSANAIDIEVPEEARGALQEIRLRFTANGVDQIYVADGWFNPASFGPD